MSRSNPNSIFAAIIIPFALFTLLLMACSATITKDFGSKAIPAMRWIDQFASQEDDEAIGADPAKWVSGGGVGYGEWVDGGTITVTTKDELLAALQQSHAGDVIYVDDLAEFGQYIRCGK